MARIDRHQLPNLSIVAKVLASMGLLLGWVLFFSVWFANVLMTGWGFSLGSFLELGEMLVQVRTVSASIFWVLFGLHAVSLPLILGLTNALFRKVSLPRGARWALMAAPIALGTLELALWLVLEGSGAARAVLPFLLALESLFVLYLVLVPLHEMWIYSRWRGWDGKKKRVVIVGGGFGGVYAAVELDRMLGYHHGLEIMLVDRKNYFLFPPMLPSVATGAIESRQVTYPFRRIFEASNVVFRKESVESVDLAGKRIKTSVEVGLDPETQEPQHATAEIDYDWLILAPGSETNTFRTEGADRFAFYMRELGDAIALRNHIIDCFEHAARETRAAIQRELLRFVIVGGGPTGVELAAEIQDLVDQVLVRRYPEIDHNFVEVYIVQSAPSVIPGWHETLVTNTAEQLRHLRVRQLLGVRVVAVAHREVRLSDETVLQTRTCVWCAGVKPSPLLAKAGLALAKDGRAAVGADLRSEGQERVFVLGDAALCPDPKTGKPLPPLAQVAVQQGVQTAGNLVRLLTGRESKPFQYFNYGSLLCVGERFAVIDLMGVQVSGFIAWFIWRTLYVAKLVGFGNKVRVVLDWTLDLLVERSISQIWTSRREVQGRPGEGAPR